MRAFWGAVILAAVLSPARAEFVLQGAPVAGPSEPGLSRTAPRPLNNTRPAPRFPSASGFGSQVTLAFAVRQIVPASVRVRYADGVDQDVLVDWSGGRAWNETLARAVKPLGLQVQATQTAVLIKP